MFCVQAIETGLGIYMPRRGNSASLEISGLGLSLRFSEYEWRTVGDAASGPHGADPEKDPRRHLPQLVAHAEREAPRRAGRVLEHERCSAVEGRDAHGGGEATAAPLRDGFEVVE